MAEAVVGTAVGILSLGIQLCQGLVSYYQSYNGQDEKIGDILQDVRTLSTTLQAVQSYLSKSYYKKLDIITQADDSIVACASAITRLNQLLSKCRQAAVPADFKERMQVLAHLRDTVKGLQSNIGITLQALQLESTILTSHNSLLELKNENRDIIQTIKQRSAQTNTNFAWVRNDLSTLNQNVSTLGRGLERALERNMDKLPGALEDKILVMQDKIVTQLAAYLNNQAHPNISQCASADNMAEQANSLSRELYRKPSLFRSVCDRVIKAEQPINDEKISSMELGLTKTSHLPIASCSCKIFSTYEFRNWSTKSLNLFRSSAISCIHQRGCPLRIPPRKKLAVGMKYSHCGLWLSRIISFSAFMTYGAGGLSISPNLTFHNTVFDTSPAFALFDSRRIGSNSSGGTSSYCKWVTQELYRLFRERKASPSDVSQSGETLLHAACRIIEFFSNVEADDVQDFKLLILSLREWGSSFNETDIDGRRPLDIMISNGVLAEYHNGLANMSLELLESGFEISESWCLVQNSDNCNIWYNYSRHMAKCLVQYCSVDEVINGLQCGPLSRAILLRSEIQVVRIIDESPDYLRERSLAGHTPMHLAASWPAGISILLNAGAKSIINKPDAAGFLPLAYASYSKCLAAVQLLVDADCAFYIDETGDGSDFFIHQDLVLDALEWSSEEIVKCIVEGLADRRRRLAAIASQELPDAIRKQLHLSPDNVLDANATCVQDLLKMNYCTIPHSLLIPNGWRTIYHLLFRDRSKVERTKLADIFYNAGFRDFIENDGFRFRNDFLITNHNAITSFILDQASEFRYITDILSLISWFLRKGLSLEYTKFRKIDGDDYVPHIPAAFYVGRSIGSMLYHVIEVDWNSICGMEPKSLLSKIVDNQTSDGCRCMCSSDGCCTITVMMKEIEMKNLLQSQPESGHVIYDFVTRLVDLLGITHDEWSFISAKIIRFLTFVRLGLTHTCCDWPQDDEYYNCPLMFNNDDRIEIQEEESADLDMLEELMFEFEVAYVKLGVSLSEFLKSHWRPRLDEVMSSEEKMDEDETRRTRELGVIWEPREQRRNHSSGGSISEPREQRRNSSSRSPTSQPREEENKKKEISPTIENRRGRRNSC